MNIHAVHFYKNRSDFQVIAMQDHSGSVFEEWVNKAPLLPKGWWELSLLPCVDRIEFVSAFWNMRFPYRPHVQKVIQEFFSRVEDLRVYLVKKEESASFVPHLVYSMNDEKSFYYGLPPVAKEVIKETRQMMQIRLSEDYVSLLKIHNGFVKNNDVGILSLEQVKEKRQFVCDELASGLYRMTFEAQPLDPHYLIPFYQRDAQFYQCFHKEWYPDQEMGTLGISLSHKESREICKTEVFPSFLSWLTRYMDIYDV